MAYRCRYWISNDAIGSLDIAQALRNGNLWGVPNALWGSGWGIVLAMAPQGNLQNGWLLQHIITATLVTVIGGIIYLTMHRLGNSNFTSFLIALAVCGAMWTSRAPVFLVSDTLSTTICSLYLVALILIYERFPKRSFFLIVFLSALHFGAYLTRAINLYLLTPTIAVLLLFCLKKKSRRKCWMLSSYYIVLLVSIGIWSVILHAKYEVWLLSSTSKYNIALVKDYNSLSPVRESRYVLSDFGTYWWSDPTTSIISLETRYPWKSFYRLLLSNLFGMWRVLIHIPFLGVCLLFVVISLCKYRLWNWFVTVLSLLCIGNLLLYLLIMVQDRFVLPSIVFGSVLLSFGITNPTLKMSTKLPKDSINRKWNLIVDVLLLICLFHSLVASIVIATWAPDDGICQLAKSIAQEGKITERTEVLIASINEKNYHYGAYVAHLLDGKAIAADILVNDLQIQSCPTALIYVNDNEVTFPSEISCEYCDFILSGSYLSGRRDKAILGLYLPAADRHFDVLCGRLFAP